MTTARQTTTRRRGYSILELLVVMAALLILGAFALPTLFGMKGDTRSKAAADMLRSRMNEARAKAMEDGTPYRLALSADQKRIRIAPDTFAANGMDEDVGVMFVAEDDLPEAVTAEVMLDEFDQVMQDDAGWVRVATFLPDGTCREDSVEVEIKEPGTVPFVVKLRGLTGAVSVIRGILEANR
jgi:prepilin-type N-terminal cleavage/methylation domain-containing protein